MLNSRDQVEKIKDSLDIVDVIGKSVTLRRDSNGIYYGATSHLSKSGASLKVDKKQQIYYDFSSRADGGDVFNWIAYEHNLSVKNDFPEILRIAADMAGIQLEDVSEEQKTKAEKKRIIQEILTRAASVYHSNLTPEIREYINKKWGINDETIDRLKIGYAKPGVGNENFGKIANSEEWTETGLFSVQSIKDANDDYTQKAFEFFKGRVMFPYWYGGKVVYFNGRGDFNTPINTPDNAFEKQPNSPEIKKYKKMLTHSEKHPYINECVTNSHIWGTDTVREHDFCVITEGIADAVVLMQNDFPVLSPATTKFAKHDIEQLLQAAKKLETVYICNDNEDSGAGEAGAIKTAILLLNEGVDVKVIILPKELGVNKIDVAEYFLKHNKTEFEVLMSESVGILTHMLRKIKVSEKKDSTEAKEENLTKAKKFVKDILTQVKNKDEGKFFISNSIKNYFPKFKREDIALLTRHYIVNKPEENSNKENAKNELFDLDSVSGRNAIYRQFADEYINAHRVKCINGKLRVYKDGIYPESDEAVDFVKTEIMKIGLSHNVNLAENNINAIEKLIEISTTVKANDCEPNSNSVIVVNNGILNMKDWTLEEFSPEKVYFSKLPVDFDPDAKEPVNFKKYLETTFAGNEIQLNLFQEMIGYTLIKNYKHQMYFFLLGPGGNGKGVAIATLRNILGPENVASESLFQLSDHQQVDYHVAKLHSKYANLCGDISSKRIENTEVIKRLTSNTDPVTARHIRERPFDFVNYAKLIFAMNRLPKTDAFTTGDKRRICVIRFENKISNTPKDIKALQDVFVNEGELPGILLWAIEGLKRLEVNGDFSDSRSIAQKSVEYDKKSRPVRHFVEEYLEEEKDALLPNSNLYEQFNKFCKQIGAAELSKDEIKDEILRECQDAGWIVRNKLIRFNKLPEEVQKNLTEAGFEMKYLRCFEGISLIPSEPQKQIIEYVKESQEHSCETTTVDVQQTAQNEYNRAFCN